MKVFQKEMDTGVMLSGSRSGVVKLPEGDQAKDVTRYTDRIVNHMVSHMVKRVREVLNKYVSITITDMTDLIPELIYYIKWAEYIQKLQERGFTFAKPSVHKEEEYASDPYMMQARGIYNLKLAVFETEESGNIVPNDLNFDRDRRVYILTGANRGGKTTNGSKVVANATSMCISSPILLIVLVTMAEDGVFHVSESLATVFGCVFLLGMVATAVFLFITYGMRESHMEHFEKECFETEYGVSGIVREKKDSYEPIFIRGTAVGVVLCILAVIPTIIAGSMEASDYYCGLSVGLLLFILAIGVNLLVRVGMVKSSYDTLLQEGEYTKEEKLFKKKTNTFSGVYWCLTTAIYLAWSFWTMSWDITWIVWPVAGVLFAALLGVVKMVLKNGSETQHYI